MTKLRMTQRRGMLNDARDRNAAKVAAAILPIFQRQQKHIEKTIIRTGGNLRRKMGKIETPFAVKPEDNLPSKIDSKDLRFALYNEHLASLENEKYRASLYKASVLLKVDPVPPFQPAPPPPPQPDTSWDTFKAALVAVLLLSLGGAADDIGGVESDVWESRGYPALQFDPDQVVQDYQSRIGRNISNISDDTLAGVQGAIAAWYISDQPYSDLIDSLGRWFDDKRANLIGRTEVGDLTSQITLQAMEFYGFTDWIWDAMGENPCTSDLTIDGNTYAGCDELNGKKFKAGASMPPDASHPNCQCQATPVEMNDNG